MQNMALSQFSLSWDAHKSNICTGLSALQQNGEFVDMTLAADGHHVKVHQVIMALASQYIKDLISTAECPHPVIFLNKISYNTLSAILEYIYTGEVQLQVAKLPEFIQAGKELHIKGLEDMDHHVQTSQTERTQDQDHIEEHEEAGNDDSEMLEEYCFFSEYDDVKLKYAHDSENNAAETIEHAETSESFDDNTFEVMQLEEQDNTAELQDTTKEAKVKPIAVAETLDQAPKEVNSVEVGAVNVLQYTVSTQGSLQMILNRFLYYLKYQTRDGQRHWRCVDYLTPMRCPALVVTRDDVVVQRVSAHIHSFHDKKILKKVRSRAIFTEIQQAEKEGKILKVKVQKNTPVVVRGNGKEV